MGIWNGILAEVGKRCDILLKYDGQLAIFLRAPRERKGELLGTDGLALSSHWQCVLCMALNAIGLSCIDGASISTLSDPSGAIRGRSAGGTVDAYCVG